MVNVVKDTVDVWQAVVSLMYGLFLFQTCTGLATLPALSEILWRSRNQARAQRPEPIFQEASFSDILQPDHLSLTRAQVEYTIPHCQPRGALVTFLQHTCVGAGEACPHT